MFVCWIIKVSSTTYVPAAWLQAQSSSGNYSCALYSAGLPPGTMQATCQPFNKICSNFVTRIPSAVYSYSTTSASTIFNIESKPKSVPSTSFQSFISIQTQWHYIELQQITIGSITARQNWGQQWIGCGEISSMVAYCAANYVQLQCSIAPALHRPEKRHRLQPQIWGYLPSLLIVILLTEVATTTESTGLTINVSKLATLKAADRVARCWFVRQIPHLNYHSPVGLTTFSTRSRQGKNIGRGKNIG